MEFNKPFSQLCAEPDIRVTQIGVCTLIRMGCCLLQIREFQPYLQTPTEKLNITPSYVLEPLSI